MSTMIMGQVTTSKTLITNSITMTSKTKTSFSLSLTSNPTIAISRDKLSWDSKPTILMINNNNSSSSRRLNSMAHRIIITIRIGNRTRTRTSISHNLSSNLKQVNSNLTTMETMEITMPINNQTLMTWTLITISSSSSSRMRVGLTNSTWMISDHWVMYPFKLT